MNVWSGRLSLAFGIWASLGCSPGLEAKTRLFAIDRERSFLGFEVSHLGFIRVPGCYHDYSGEVEWEDGAPAPTRIDLKIQVASIDTKLKWRDEVLRGPEFFDVTRTPQVVFASRSIKALGNGRLEIAGDLTIRGITLPLAFQLGSTSAPSTAGSPKRWRFKGEFLVVRLPYGVGAHYAPPFIGELVTIKLDGEMVER